MYLVAKGTESVLNVVVIFLFKVEILPPGGPVLIIHKFFKFCVQLLLFLNEFGHLVLGLQFVLHTFLGLAGVPGVQLRQLVLVLQPG